MLKKNLPTFILAVTLVIGTFFRFYRLPEFVTFLGDQARDAIILRRILTLEHLPAIGASSSVGGVYLGPFYYYFIAPWLAIFGFNPVGPAYGVAFFSSVFLLINYLVIKKLLDQETAVFSTVVVAFSSTLINFSRFSWNPNLLPLFSLLTFFFVVRSGQTKKMIYFVLAGAFLSFTIQLHYLALFLIPPVFIYYLLQKDVFKLNRQLVNLMAFAASFTFFSLPLIIFDLRHQFLNFRNFLSIFHNPSNVGGNKITSLFSSFTNLNLYLFNINLPTIFLIIVFFAILMIAFYFRRREQLWPFFLFFFFTILGISFYTGQKLPHYLGTVYPFYIVIFSYVILKTTNKYPIKVILIVFFLSAYLFLNLKSLKFLVERGPNQITLATKVARIIDKNNTSRQYALASLPAESSDSPYRYFLEVWGKRPVERDSLTKVETLFITCEHPCQTIGNPQWDIAYFAPKKVTGTWKEDIVTIYKLSH
jgi:hypothetical protein